MKSTIDWPTFSSTDTPIDILVKLSRYYGSDSEFVRGDGGSTSLKIGDRLYVKASGYNLGNIGPDGFVQMDRKALQSLPGRNLGDNTDQQEARFKESIMAARIDAGQGLCPSIECVLHNLLPSRFVVHTHSTAANIITCCTNGKALLDELFDPDVLWIPFAYPDLMLANALNDAIKDYARRTAGQHPTVILLQGHGLIVCGDTPDQIRRRTDLVTDKIRRKLDATPGDDVFGSVDRLDAAEARKLINVIAPALRGLLGDPDALKVVAFDDSDIVISLAAGQDGRTVTESGAVTPDQVVYCSAFPMWCQIGKDQRPRQIVEHLGQAIAKYQLSNESPPKVVLIEGLGFFAVGEDFAGAEMVRMVYAEAIKVTSGARRLGGIMHMSTRVREFFQRRELPANRRKIPTGSAGQGRVAGKVAVVTGAAQGFGLEIAQDLVQQEAEVVLADINSQGSAIAIDKINTRFGRERALAVTIDVADAESVEDAFHRIVRTYGGLDLLISNAGVLRAQSVKTQSKDDFQFVTDVNYTGYFLCVQKASAIMAVQHMARSDYFSDIIQINSKSGLVGSNRNAAYAGSKFGGIGLTQSFAMELIEDGIKVNAICPGNFFDGPLWSDPQTGLFVQYLQAGKVPTAKTIDDVRRAYEQKIPMGRGCTVADVMKAIYYLIDQKYETGQALPVTGGQVMLR